MNELEGRRKEGKEVVGGPWDGKGGESCGEGKSVEFAHTQMRVYKSGLLCRHCPSCVNEDVKCVNIRRLVVRKKVLRRLYQLGTGN